MGSVKCCSIKKKIDEDLDEFNLSDPMKDFEDNPVGGDKIKTETTP